MPPARRTRRRVLLATAALLALAAPAALAAPGLAAPGGGAPDAGAVLNILPPGSNGTVTPAEFAAFTATGTRPHNSADQLEAYDALNRVDPATVTDASLTPSYYKDGRLGVAAADVVSTITPRADVTIRRDRDGVPHVVGTTYGGTLFGAGYAGTQDRMFLQDTLRHVGAARAAEFLGPSPANIAMDAAQLRAAAYTHDEAAAQIGNLARRYGAEGAKYAAGVDDFLAGINAAQQAMCPAGSPVAPTCPVEYGALQIRPTPFDRADIVFIASLVGGIFGKGGGQEDVNARWLQQLQGQLGAAAGRRVYDDLREVADPEAPTTSPTPVPFGLPGPLDATATLLPAVGAAQVDGTGSMVGAPLPTGTGTPAAPDHLDGPLGRIDLSLRPHGMSNALLVDAAHSATGHPVTVFGPQTGYFAPQLLVEVDLRGPGIAARGVSFAGTQAVVQLGHGVDYAWSATSSSDDNVDIVAERLCSTTGGAVTTSSDGYLVDGVCTPVEKRTHQEVAKPSAGGPGTQVVLSFDVERTRHGILEYRTTTPDGTPIALVTQRSTYGGEFDSVVGFARINNPDYVHSAADFRRAFAAVDYTFNWFYADSRDIAYYNSARLPIRAAGVDPSLPRDGARTALDWQGFVDPAALPQATNPPAGYLVSWNNKQAPGFAANDAQWSYGPVYRSLTLSDRIAARLSAGQTFSRAQLVGAMADAATVDVRGAYLVPLALDVIASAPGGVPADLQPAVSLLRGWVARGAHRVDRARTGAYADQAAVALADTWWESQTTASKGSIALGKDVLRGALGSLVDALPQPLDDHPRQGRGSSWNDVAWYGYVSKDLRKVLGRAVAGPYSRGFCGAGQLAACRQTLRGSLRSAVAEVLRAQGKTDITAATYDKHADDIRASAVGVVGVRPIDWQNRPTFQQVVSFTAARADETPTPAVPEAPYAAGLLALAAALGTAWVLRRRRPAP